MTKIQVVQLKQEILKEIHINNNTTFSSPDVSGEFFIDYIGNFDREVFAVVGMNVKNKLFTLEKYLKVLYSLIQVQ